MRKTEDGSVEVGACPHGNSVSMVLRMRPTGVATPSPGFPKWTVVGILLMGSFFFIRKVEAAVSSLQYLELLE